MASLQGVFSKVVSKAAEQFAKVLADRALTDSVGSKAIRDAISGTIGTAAAVAVDFLLTATARRVDEVGAKLDKVLQEPLATGVRIVERTYATRWDGQDQLDVRAQELRTADESLERAYSFANDNHGRFVIRMMQLLCVATERGAAPKFRTYLEELKELHSQMQDDVDAAIRDTESYLVRMRQGLLRFKSDRFSGEPGGFAHWSEGTMLVRDIEKSEGELKEAKHQGDLLREIGIALTSATR